MDLFKAIFAGSSSESSSSESDEEEQEEQQEVAEEETPRLFNIAPPVASSVSSATIPQTGRTTVHQQQVQHGALSEYDSALPLDGALSAQRPIKEELGEEFGPKLPPPSAVPPSRQTGRILSAFSHCNCPSNIHAKLMNMLIKK